MTEKPGPTEQEKKHLSKGERFFNWLTYGGIAGLGTFIVTIPIAYWAKYGKGVDRFHQISGHLKSTGLSEQTTEQIMMTTVTAGGNLMVLPVKWAEDHKVAIVTKINDMFGEKTDVAELESHEKQSWGSIIKARVMAWGVVFLGLKGTEGVVGKDNFTKFENKFSEYIVCKPLGSPTHINGERTKAFKYGKIAAFDFFATIASSALLYAGSRFFARIKPQESEPNTGQPPQAQTLHDITYKNNIASSSQRVSSIIANRQHDEGFAAALANRSVEPSQLGA